MKPESRKCLAILGIRFDVVDMRLTLDRIGAMVRSRVPHYLATANVDFLVQARFDIELRRILLEADLVLCDGTPLVWLASWLGQPLPERVAGSDLVPQLLAEAENLGWRVFFLGGSSKSIADAETNTRAKHPKLHLTAYSPPFRPLLEMDHEDLLERLKAAKPDIVLVAFGCPKQEKWIRMNYRRAGIPVCIGVGATIDFLAGTVSRAPKWMQRGGVEWIYRLAQEPKRLLKRYATDLWVFGRDGLIQSVRWHPRRHAESPERIGLAVEKSCWRVDLPTFFDRYEIANSQMDFSAIWDPDRPVLIVAERVTRIDSTALGMLAGWHQAAQRNGQPTVVVAPSAALRRASRFMGWDDLFTVVDSLDAAWKAIADLKTTTTIQEQDLVAGEHRVALKGEIIAATADHFRSELDRAIEIAGGSAAKVVLDLSGVRFIDSTGAGLLVRAHKRAVQAGLKLRITSTTATVENVLRMLKLFYLLEPTQ
jgi:N-acetylglucosaminyldiphosphoundecaprenol N-acetyl-beta-D-mannosaminyltransferase